ncbi:hypothetical protein L6Q21_05045 [Sandaracinobacter sp. RS1-74]|uniref:hypothetical protein n=1 Tax=Sandaracinobacteroides sayramensis TaxID=2913411 RepID=UPI001EDBD299|nr:hypothetical protein [Sandaracinobacteroides sayramensis]MCG2840344.1 hypothetical protein [Sandaracinobacteroides sayramensis]
MGQLVERLLPWLLAAVAGLVLAIGLQGFRAERPALQEAPAATAALITEVADPVAEVVLSDGAVLVLRPGDISYDLARALNGFADLPLKLDATTLAASPLAEAADANRSFLATVALLKAQPAARIRIEGESQAAGELKARLEKAGLAPEQVELPPAAEPPAPFAPLALVLVSR